MKNKSNFCEKYKNINIDDNNRELFLKDFYIEIEKLFKEDLSSLKSDNNPRSSEFENLKYAVFYTNPFTTLKKGDIYFIGTNPGGGIPEDDCNCYLKESYEDFLKPKYEKYFDYTDGNWYRTNNPKDRGQYTLQLRITDMLRKIIKKLELKTKLYEIFCINLYFYRSKSLKDIIIYREFWQYHEVFLNIIKPKIIICCGNDEDYSPFLKIKKYFNPDPKKIKQKHVYNNYNFKWFNTKNENWNRKKILVIGHPHLSHCDINSNQSYDEFLQKNIEKF